MPDTMLFTLHSATIKTAVAQQRQPGSSPFTLHSATIKTTAVWSAATSDPYLHYTLLLLKRDRSGREFHKHRDLHYTLLLLKLYCVRIQLSTLNIYITLCYY